MLSMSQAPIHDGGAYWLNLAVEDYYLIGGEPLGRWWGRGAEKLGLFGTVEAEKLRNILAGYSPDGRRELVQLQEYSDGRQRAQGWDLCFSAPKSVSIAWSQADPERRAQIAACHERAVREALSYLQQVAAVSRIGKAGGDQIRAELVVAAFEHGTSRSQDAQLHTHCLVCNVGVCEDGVTRTIHSLPLYQHKMAAGALYRQALAYHLEQELGLLSHRKESWFELDGVPEALILEHSKRRQHIEDRLAELDLGSAIAAAYAALETRQVKEHLPREVLIADWQATNEDHGFDSPALNSLLGQKKSHNRELELNEVLSQATERVTDFQSHFAERDFFRYVAELSQTTGVPPADVLQATRTYLATSPEIVRMPSLSLREEVRYTTHEMITVEQEFIATSFNLHQRRTHAVSQENVEQVIEQRIQQRVRAANPTELKRAEEHAAALRHLTLETGDLAVLNGRAGTGKTTLLNAAREVWESHGYRVIGASLAGIAARGLEAGASIKSDTLAARLLSLSNDTRNTLLDHRTVLVLDEAGMVGTRHMEQIITLVQERGAKLVLVGDERQLSPIAAGGPFRALAENLGSAELTVITRQRDAKDIEAVNALFDGRAEKALSIAAERGRIKIGDTREEAISLLVADWAKQGVRAPRENLIFCATNYEAAVINRACQSHRKSHGRAKRHRTCFCRQNLCLLKGPRTFH